MGVKYLRGVDSYSSSIISPFLSVIFLRCAMFSIIWESWDLSQTFSFFFFFFLIQYIQTIDYPPSTTSSLSHIPSPHTSPFLALQKRAGLHKTTIKCDKTRYKTRLDPYVEAGHNNRIGGEECLNRQEAISHLLIPVLMSCVWFLI